jgi:hypothetical protein
VRARDTTCGPSISSGQIAEGHLAWSYSVMAKGLLRDSLTGQPPAALKRVPDSGYTCSGLALWNGPETCWESEAVKYGRTFATPGWRIALSRRRRAARWCSSAMGDSVGFGLDLAQQ